MLKGTWLRCAVSAWFVACAPVAVAKLVTIEFEGPVTAGFYADPASVTESFLTGKVTYESNTQGSDIRGPFDRGDRNFFPGAVVSLSFSSPEFSRSYSGSGIQLFNDYQPCTGRSQGRCIQYGEPERDRLHFIENATEDHAEFIIIGKDQSLLSSGDLPVAFSFQDVSRVDFFWDSTIGFVGSNDIRLTSVSVSAQGAAPSVWSGKPIPEQVPGSMSAFPLGVGKINTALWFNDSIDRATVTIDDRYEQISNPRLHCAPAGQEGPLIWQEAGTFTQTANGKEWRFGRGDILESGVQEGCGVVINTVASLHAAAQQRHLYLEYYRDGVRHRAQLWPSDQVPIEVTTFASHEQVIEQQLTGQGPVKSQARFRATETAAVLNQIEYLFNDSYGGFSQIERAELYCAPAGQAGVRVADLPSRSANYQPLRRADLVPASSDGPCGVEINTIASLVEAWLQGRLYILVARTDGLLLRGQIPRR